MKARNAGRTVGERLREQRVRKGLSQEQMAEAAGIPIETYKKYERNKRMPGGDALGALARMGLSVAELLLGDRADSPGQAATAEQPRAGYVYLPLYDVRAKAGAGAVVEAEQQVDALAFKEDWIRRELRAAPADLRLIYVEGDSMEPDLRAGDIVLIDHTDTTARREGIYVLRMEGALLVKQLQRLPGGIVKVLSRNAAYEPFTVPLTSLEESNEFAVVGRVVWACRRF
jgi:phage repressor protein C with HTH and peptisase S24 domain/DNA-binding XRE family transcriptional regulator